MKLRVKARGDALFPRFNAEGRAPPGVYAGRDPARQHAPFDDGELVADTPETRKACLVGDLELLEETDDAGRPLAPAAPTVAPRAAKAGGAA
jgi:hypothetical protein